MKHQNTNKRKNYDIGIIIFFLSLGLISIYTLFSSKRQQYVGGQGVAIASVVTSYNEVRFRKNADFRWQPVDRGQSLNSKDRIFTGKDSQVDIVVQKNKVRIKENSLIEIGIQDFDMKFEFGHIMLEMDDRPLRIIIKDKRYEISPREATTLSIAVKGEKVEFIGDQDKVQITQEDAFTSVEVVKRNFFNPEFCQQKTYVTNFDLTRLCPDCSERNGIIHESSATSGESVDPRQMVLLNKGKNVFRYAETGEVCEIELLTVRAPEIKTKKRLINLDYVNETVQVPLEVIDDAAIKERKTEIEYSTRLEFDKYRTLKVNQPEMTLSLQGAGTYYVRARTCFGENCSGPSAVTEIQLVRPALLPPPKLEGKYFFRKKKNLTRQPDNDPGVFSFESVKGAVSYRYEIKPLEVAEEWKEMAGEVERPEIDLSGLPLGQFRLRLYPVDRWGRVGAYAETLLTIDEDPVPEEGPAASLADKKEESPWTFRYTYFAALSSFTINQKGSLGESTGADLSASWLNSAVGARKGDTDLQLKYQTYNINAESSDKELSFLGHEILLDTTWRRFKLGAGLRDVPYLKVKDDFFRLESETLPFIEVGWGSPLREVLEDTSAFVALKFRHHASPQGLVKKYAAIIVDEEGQTLLSKNGLYLYHGLELSYERVGLAQDSSQNVFRGLLKIGVGLEL